MYPLPSRDATRWGGGRTSSRPIEGSGAVRPVFAPWAAAARAVAARSVGLGVGAVRGVVAGRGARVVCVVCAAAVGGAAAPGGAGLAAPGVAVIRPLLPLTWELDASGFVDRVLSFVFGVRPWCTARQFLSPTIKLTIQKSQPLVEENCVSQVPPLFSEEPWSSFEYLISLRISRVTMILPSGSCFPSQTWLNLTSYPRGTGSDSDS
jgi:hypothetical protein